MAIFNPKLASVVLCTALSLSHVALAQGRAHEPNANSTLMSYIVSCALPAKEQIELDGNVFTGSLSLAPNWRTNGLSEAERELVSSCLLARTNAFGVSVRISIRAPENSDIPSVLEATPSEKIEFSEFEAGFFGNVFIDDMPSFVCHGVRSRDTAATLRAQQRICSLPSGKTTSTGQPVSQCGYVIVGSCSDPEVFTQNGVTYSQPIFVFLSKDMEHRQMGSFQKSAQILSVDQKEIHIDR
ncbi:hypothetical protein [uncultured Ruegeria sp.]|uniref:hypothetical protein n=1 Tax=uncultured Ruegeria sp. TaxID=259304 RepID=UPI00262FC55D|nr:hypothetical protein [uncultured Ruegeria sp.]